jgi:hypothetical protein
MHRQLTGWLCRLVLVSMVFSARLAVAELPALDAASADSGSSDKPTHEMSLAEISAKLNNPLSDLWMIWLQNDRMKYNGDLSSRDRTIDVKYFEPVISIPMGDTWNLVSRPVITRIDAQVPEVDLPRIPGDGLGGTPGGGDFGGINKTELAETVLNNADWDNQSAWGDLIFISMISPQQLPTVGDAKIAWGVGATTMWPTASKDLFGTEKYSAGPAALALYMGPKWRFGALGQQWWSYAGESDRKDVSRMNLQYFWFYDLGNLWQLGAAPNITANWKADSDNRWTVPLGIGINKTVKIGRLPVRFAVELHKTVVQPDAFGMDWNLRFVVIPVIPNLVKMYQGTLQLPE